MSGIPLPASSQMPPAGSSGGGGNLPTPPQPGQPSPSPTAQSSQSIKSRLPPSDQAVMDYLKAKGMGTALLELQAKLSKENSEKTTNSVDPNNPKAVDQKKMMDIKKKCEHEEDEYRYQGTMQHKATGGGFGYDRDAAAPIVQWGIPNNTTSEESPQKRSKKSIAAHLGEKEAEAYLDAFIALQLWVLSLPDDPEGTNLQPKLHDPLAKARELIAQNGDKKIGISTILKDMAIPNTTKSNGNPNFQLPPSSKPELLAVTFALLVHTYCELLEVGMEASAHVLRDTFSCLYEPLYGEELKDLNIVTTTAEIVKLNTQYQEYIECLNKIKQIYIRIAENQLKIERMRAYQFPNTADPQKKQQIERSRKESMLRYQNDILHHQEKHKELKKKADDYFGKVANLDFLRRARGVRWQLTLSAASYGLLATFLNNTMANPALLAMSTLLQTKCEILVEQRDPLPITPAVIFDEESDRAKEFRKTALVNWAAPSQSQLPTKKSKRPFPKFYLDEEYDDERAGKKDKRIVAFNRSMLVNGFRRLEALERKREFQTMKSRDSPKVTANPLEPSILLSTLSANNTNAKSDGTNATPAAPGSTPAVAAPSKKSSSSSSSSSNKTPMTAAMWEEAGIGITCAKLCPPDGRRVAVGCDDAAIRIWDLGELPSDGLAGDAAQVLLGHKNGFPVFDISWNRDGRSLLSAGGDGTIRLWDTMLQGPYGNASSADNTDSPEPTSTTVTSPKKPAEKNSISPKLKEDLKKATKELEKAKESPDMSVPGLKPESNYVPSSGAALAVYRHAAQKPIWSTAFAPCGYYFASAGADSTARLWTTDRIAPVRLFCGHTANSVNTVAWHPNCNYILTGSDDKTARLWDIQTGKCVRLLNGCSSGVSQVRVDPSGQYAVGADVTGAIHLWDLGTSKKITEFRPPAGMKNGNGNGSNKKNQFSQHHRHMAMCHSLSFSGCGTALASGGDDRCVRIWDIRKAVEDEKPVIDIPAASFATRRTMLMDLHYTKRNLLLSVGKYINH